MKKNSAGFIQIILVLILIVIVGVAAYYFGTQKNKQAFLPTPKPVSSAQPPTNPISDPTANWKTYTSEEQKFTVKYPSFATTTSREAEPFPNVVQIQDLKPRTGGGGGPEVTGWILVISEIQSNPNNLSLREWAKEKKLTIVDPAIASISEITDTKIGGLPAITWETVGGDAALTYYLVRRENGMQLIWINNDSSSNLNLIDQVLSTFKFTK